MVSVNGSIIFSLVVGAITLAALTWVATKQFYEVLLPKSWLTRLRWIILGTLLVAITGLIPVLVYQVTRLMGTDNELLRNIASVLGNLSRLAGAALLVLVYTYKKEDK